MCKQVKYRINLYTIYIYNDQNHVIIILILFKNLFEVYLH